MTCLDAERYVSALYDGEPIPSDAARHIAECGSCRLVLNDYSNMGAEMRLAAAIQTSPLPSLPPPSRRTLWQFLKASVRVPRFAIASLIGCLLIATAAAVALHAQSRPLWFQFAYGLQENPQFDYKVVQAGFEDGGGMIGLLNGSVRGVGVRVRIESISSEDVALRIRAVPSKGMSIGLADVPRSLAGVPITHYKPGDNLSVAMEGGGVIYLQGKVFDHQPKIAFGLPLEPEADQLFVRSPVLTAEGRLIGQSSGSNASSPRDGAVILNTKEGKFTFALKQFPGAVEAKANWGQIAFKIADVRYRLVAAAPITGGDQPAKLWVRRDDADGSVEYLGSGSSPLH